MAIKRRVQYDVEVTGAVRAAQEIGELDDAADGARSALGGSGDAAAAAARDYARAEAEARSLGDAFDDVNQRAGEAGGRFGDVRSRLGDLEDAVMLLSGVAFIEFGQTLVETVQTLYRYTDAGRQAQQVTEALAESVSSVASEFAGLDPKKASELAKAMTKAGAATSEYERHLQAATKQALRVDELREQLEKLGDVDLTKTGLAAVGDTYAYRQAKRNLDIAEAQLEQLDQTAQNAFAAAEKQRAKMIEVQADIENEQAARERLLGQMGREALAWAESAAGVFDYRAELQAANGALNGQLDIFARLGAAGVEAYKGIAEAIGKAREKAAKPVKPPKPTEDRFVSMSWEEVGAAHAEAYYAGLERAAREHPTPLEVTARSMEEVGADHAAAYYEGIAREQAAADQALETILGTNAAIRSGADAWESWQDYALGALGAVSSVLGSVRMAMDAIVDRELTIRRNAVASAQAQLQGAETAEERAAAEEKVYKAQVQLQKAEQEAAEARRRFKVLEFALEGAKMAAKSIEAAALAQMLAALPFGVGAPFVPAAVAASVTYGTAAAAFGVAAGVTAATPTAQGTPPAGPDDGLADRTIGAGDRDGRGGGDVINLNFAGQPFETRHDLHDAMIEGFDVASRRRGRNRANFAALQRRGRGRT